MSLSSSLLEFKHMRYTHENLYYQHDFMSTFLLSSHRPERLHTILVLSLTSDIHLVTLAFQLAHSPAAIAMMLSSYFPRCSGARPVSLHVALTVLKVHAMLQFSCSQFMIERLDSLINLGLAGFPRLYQVVGGYAFNTSMDPVNDMPFLSTCTTCTFSENFSNHRTPVLYFKARMEPTSACLKWAPNSSNKLPAA